MEVNSHTHTPRKKWTHYFWEFLMLFLAVFCGFLAENQREHFIENQRAKKFAASLIEDLQADTAEVRANKEMIEGFLQTTDLVVSELRKPRFLQNDTVLQLKGVFGLLDFNFFDPQMGNYEQIKNSGGLRYFKQALVSKLTRYESFTNRLVLQKQNYLDFINAIVTPFVIKNLNHDFIDAVHKKELYHNGPVFITEPDKLTLSQWKNIVQTIRLRQQIQKETIEIHKTHAIELIDELRKAYHLK